MPWGFIIPGCGYKILDIKKVVIYKMTLPTAHGRFGNKRFRYRRGYGLNFLIARNQWGMLPDRK